MDEFEKTGTAKAAREIIKAIGFGSFVSGALLAVLAIVLAVLGLGRYAALELVAGLCIALWIILGIAVMHLEPSKK